MKKLWILSAVLFVANLPVSAVGISGEWTSGLTFTSGIVSLANTLTLELAGPGWQLTSSWDPSFLDISSHTLILKTSIGPVGVTAGASFLLAAGSALPQVGPRGELAIWAADGFALRSGFVSFELLLGDVTLRLTLHRGRDE